MLKSIVCSIFSVFFQVIRDSARSGNTTGSAYVYDTLIASGRNTSLT